MDRNLDVFRSCEKNGTGNYYYRSEAAAQKNINKINPDQAGTQENVNDVNGDGIVNILDLIQIANSFEQEAPDVNSDGVVNLSDLVSARSQTRSRNKVLL